ncbi:MAG: T9SS type A sorting domain-containing protein [Bacteroidales bacterium]|nr:T9SS type A sorting domain-containing protein [Bacteroidales bacterium]
MKKIFTLFMAMAIVSISFAQLAPKVEKQASLLAKPAKKAMNAPKILASGSWWYDLCADLETWNGTDPEYGLSFTMCDQNGLVPWSNSDPSPVQHFAFGQIYDWGHQCWNYIYNVSAFDGYDIPNLGGTDQYTIDSINFFAAYYANDSVVLPYTDTLRVSYVLNLDNEPVHTPQYYYDNTYTDYGPGFSWLWIPYDVNTFSASTSTWNAYDSAYISLSANAVVVVQDILLTSADMDTSGWLTKAFPAPAALQNISCKRMAVGCTFIPGGPRSDTSIIGRDLNAFRFYFIADPRIGGELNYALFGEDAINDVQSGLEAGAEIFDENDRDYGMYGSLVPWSFTDSGNGNFKPSIGLHATCTNCGEVNVPEIEKDAVVYPNPATSQITVNTNNDQKVLVEMFNLVGQKVYSEQVVNSTNINVSNFQAGVYMLKVNNQTIKVVVR